METIRNVEINQLHDFRNHPFKVEVNTELCDTMQVFEQLQQYAKDTGYHGSFDELYEMASAISEENR